MTVKEAHAKAAVENCKFRVAGVLRGEWYHDHVLKYVDQHGDEECTMHKTNAMISVDVNGRGDKDMVKITVSSDEYVNEISGKSVVAFILDPAKQDGDTRQADAAVMLHGTGDPKQMVLSAAVSLGTLIDRVTDDEIERLMLAALVVKKLKSSVIDEEAEILSTKMMSQHVSPEEDDEDV